MPCNHKKAGANIPESEKREPDEKTEWSAKVWDEGHKAVNVVLGADTCCQGPKAQTKSVIAKGLLGCGRYLLGREGY